MNQRLEDRVCLVTGASRGIGAAIARAFAREGARVALNYHRSEGPAREVRESILADGGHAELFRADVSREDEVETMIRAIRESLGPLEVLVNNAGITQPRSLEEITVADWDHVLQTNLRSMFLVTMACLPDMRRSGFGRIINLTSVAAQLGGVVGPHYAASKAGAIGLTHSFAHLLSSEGITANAIAPALVWTDMVSGNPAAAEELIPLGRFGHVDEVSDVAVLLATNGYITGQTFNVNGGWYMSS